MDRDHFFLLVANRMALGIAASTALAGATHAQPPMVAIGSLAGPGPVRASLPWRSHDGKPRGRQRDEVDPVAADAGLRAELQRRMAHHRRELLPEYEHRLGVDGRSEADAWLRREAADRARHEAATLVQHRAHPSKA